MVKRAITIKYFSFPLVLLAGLLLLSCEKTIDLELDEVGGKPVLYSFIQPDSLFSVSLSQSVSTLSGAEYELITGAKIMLFKNSDYSQYFEYSNDSLWQDFQGVNFAEGDSVVLAVWKDNETIASAVTYIPSVSQIERLDTLRKFKVDSKGVMQQVMDLTVSLNDESKSVDYYQLKLFALTTYQTHSGDSTVMDPIVFSKSDRVFYDYQQGSSSLGIIDFDGLFTDEKINGLAYNVHIPLDLKYFDNNNPNINRQFIVRMYHVTSDYYSYLRSRIVADAYTNIPFIDPVKIPSNVNGGFGIVSGISVFADTLVVQ
jgi:hypothetical protein